MERWTSHVSLTMYTFSTYASTNVQPPLRHYYCNNQFLYFFRMNEKGSDFCCISQKRRKSCRCSSVIRAHTSGGFRSTPGNSSSRFHWQGWKKALPGELLPVAVLRWPPSVGWYSVFVSKILGHSHLQIYLSWPQTKQHRNRQQGERVLIFLAPQQL